MESITDGLSRIEISSRALSYAKAFRQIVSYVRKIRKQPLSAAEIDVTRCLAGPFDTGGLMIVLQEPLQEHPWSEGANAVISRCPTLDALREGILIGSNGSFSLLHHVSILDIREFICKESNYSLTKDQRENLYSLVIAAMEAKRPDVVLCMGKEPTSLLHDRKSQFSNKFWGHVHWIDAMHPSHSINYNSDNIEKRSKLLSYITEACSIQSLKDPTMYIVKMSRCRPTAAFRVKQPNGVLEDTRWVEILLWALVELCLPPPYLLPVSGLVADCFNNLEGWQRCYFDYVLKLSDTERTVDETIATALIAPFQQLNECLNGASWYLNAYDADCEGIRRFLESHGATIERVCDCHDEQDISVCGKRKIRVRERTEITSDWVSRGEIISIRIANILHRKSAKPRRAKKWRPT